MSDVYGPHVSCRQKLRRALALGYQASVRTPSLRLRHYVGSGSSRSCLHLPLLVRVRGERERPLCAERDADTATRRQRQHGVRGLRVRTGRQRAGHASRRACRRKRIPHRAGTHRLLRALLRRHLHLRRPPVGGEERVHQGQRAVRVGNGLVARRLRGASWGTWYDF
jgi:hypothetical protein